MVERVLDQPLAKVMEQRIFRPSGMTSSSLFGQPDVQGYVDNTPVEDYYLQLHPAAGSVVSTVGDVHAFFRSLWGGKLVGAQVVADMQESRGQVLVGQYWRPDYGLGLIHYEVGCGVALGHSGRIGGFTVEAWTLQDSDRSTVVMVNDQGADDIARGIVEIALCS
jgi:D-alanyl-D-alanine carboxypeptidase